MTEQNLHEHPGAAGVGIALHRRGSGQPLVLLHALGLSSHTWAPVVPGFAERFEVITVDLPGFGASPALPARTRPTPAAFRRRCRGRTRRARHTHAARRRELDRRLGCPGAARLRPLASLTLLSPAGVWPGNHPAVLRSQPSRHPVARRSCAGDARPSRGPPGGSRPRPRSKPRPTDRYQPCAGARGHSRGRYQHRFQGDLCRDRPPAFPRPPRRPGGRSRR